jgi:hypothetical protein
LENFWRFALAMPMPQLIRNAMATNARITSLIAVTSAKSNPRGKRHHQLTKRNLGGAPQ